MHSDLTRRGFLGGLAAAGLLSACTSDVTPSAPAGQPWSFTDDRGISVSRDTRPARIVSYDTTGSALWYLGVEPVGIFAGSPLADSPSLAGLDLQGIEAVGEVYGEINLEKLAALQPDLIVTAFDPRQAGPVFGFADDGVQDRAGSVAPILAIDGTRDPIAVIEQFRELAAALGADLDAPAVVDARARFEEVSTELRAALTSRPGLLAVALTTFDNEVYFARPATFPGLRQLRQLGLALVEPPGGATDVNSDFNSFFWDVVSYEEAGRYPADLILYDLDPSAAQPDALAAIPTMAALAAVRARQFAPWRKLEDWSYQSYTRDIEAVLAAVLTSNPGLVP